MKTYKISYAAAVLKVGYNTAFKKLSEAGALVPDPETGRVAVKAEFIDKLQGKTKHVNAHFFQDNRTIFDPPPLPSGVALVTTSMLKSHLPLLEGMIENMEALKRLVSFGRWRVKIANGVNRFYLQDFYDLKAWATPAEASFRDICEQLAPVVTEHPENETARLALGLAEAWLQALYEERVGNRRALGRVRHGQHKVEYEAAKTAIYKNEDAWKSSVLLGLLRPGTEVVL